MFSSTVQLMGILLIMNLIYLPMLAESNPLIINKLVKRSGATEFSTCLLRVINNSFKIGEVIFIYYGKNITAINNLVLLTNITIYQSTSSSVKHKYLGVTGYIFIINNFEELQDITAKLSADTKVWNSKAKVVVSCNSCRSTFHNIIQTLWSVNLYNILIVDKTKLGLDLLTWYPYKNNCGDNYTLQSYLGSCINATLFLNGSTKLFTDKIPRRFNGCELKVRTDVWEPFVYPIDGNGTFTAGFEIELVNTIGKYANLNIFYSTSSNSGDWAETLTNGSGTNHFYYVHRKLADVLVCSTINTPERNAVFDATPSYFQDFDLFCAPVAQLRPQWYKWIDLFKIYTYLFVFELFFVLIIYKLANYTKDEIKTYKRVATVAQNLTSIACNVPVTKLPISIRIRLFTLLWIIFTMHLQMVYNTSLTSVIQQPLYERQIRDTESLLYSKFPLLFMDHYKRYFINQTSPTSKLVLERMIDCSGTTECLTRVAQQRNAAMCAQKSYVEYRMGQYLDPVSKRPLIYVFREAISVSPIVMLMRKGLPMKERICRLIHACKEAGLVEKWVMDLYTSNRRKMATKGSEAFEMHGLRMGQLRLIFIFLYGGIFVSVFTFCVEVFFPKKLETV